MNNGIARTLVRGLLNMGMMESEVTRLLNENGGLSMRNTQEVAQAILAAQMTHGDEEIIVAFWSRIIGSPNCDDQNEIKILCGGRVVVVVQIEDNR